MKKILFIDRDGTIVAEPHDEQVDDLSKIVFLPEVIPCLLQLKKCGYTFVMVTNQDGIGSETFPEDTFWPSHNFIVDLLKSQGIEFEEILICPHFPSDNCQCRKPKTGLLTSYIVERRYDLEHSYVIGDRDTDVELAKNMGIVGLKIGPNLSWPQIVERLTLGERTASMERTTKETKVNVYLNLDQEGKVSVATGLGFLDHMLEQLLKHSGTSGMISCRGDLAIDDHHSIEDVAITVGETFRKALGDKWGIERYGFLLPMDESLCQVALDLSGRFSFLFEGSFKREKINDLSTEMISHFLRSFAEGLKANLAIKVTGENDHHKAEAIFKSLGRTLKQAKTRTGGEIPSSKGAL